MANEIFFHGKKLLKNCQHHKLLLKADHRYAFCLFHPHHHINGLAPAVRTWLAVWRLSHVGVPVPQGGRAYSRATPANRVLPAGASSVCSEFALKYANLQSLCRPEMCFKKRTYIAEEKYLQIGVLFVPFIVWFQQLLELGDYVGERQNSEEQKRIYLCRWKAFREQAFTQLTSAALTFRRAALSFS